MNLISFDSILGNDDAPSAPDLQLDWSSSSDSENEDGSVEVLGTVNQNKVNIRTSFTFTIFMVPIPGLLSHQKTNYVSFLFFRILLSSSYLSLK